MNLISNPGKSKHAQRNSASPACGMRASKRPLAGWSFTHEGAADASPSSTAAAPATLASTPSLPSSQLFTPSPASATRHNTPHTPLTTSTASDGAWSTHDFIFPVEGRSGFCRRCLAGSPSHADAPPTNTTPDTNSGEGECIPATDDEAAGADIHVPMLTAEQVDRYFAEGFLELHEFYSAKTVAELQRWAEVLELVRGLAGAGRWWWWMYVCACVRVCVCVCARVRVYA
jgi:hypothetical protein